MRVGDATFYLRYLTGIKDYRQDTDEALASLADGKKVRVSSDDPVGSRESLDLRKRLVQLAGFDRSAGSGRTALSTLDSVLGQAYEILTEARSIAMAGASTATAEQNQIRATEIEALREQLLSLANTSQGGRYLFGGTETRTPPFDTDGNYSGNDTEVQAPIDTTEQVGATLSGDRVFNDGQDVFAMLTDLADALRDNRTDDIAALVPDLGEAIDHMTAMRAEVGTRMSRIDDVLVRHGDEELLIAERISVIEDADLTEVIVQLQSAETASAALSAAAARVLGRSLFDYLG